jgi:hypothetical protein
MESLPDSNDLSEYEKLRLQNIKRNSMFLKSIGLNINQPTFAMNAEKNHTNVKKRESSIGQNEILPVRCSKRIRVCNFAEQKEHCQSNQIQLQPSEKCQKENGDVSDPSEIQQGRNKYTKVVSDSADLDDFEFQVYVKARRWRQNISKELVVECHKIFLNKTLADVIRRKRNDECWAMEPHTEEHLLQCWGMGPSKAKIGGFGSQLLAVISDENCREFLQQSRDSKPIPDDDNVLE